MAKPLGDSKGWTIETYAAYNEALRAAEEKFQQERDRRYAEVEGQREIAVRIKENADVVAMGLARDIQTYKDEKANELREQIGNERLLYATKADVQGLSDKFDVSLKPISNFVATQQGRTTGISSSWAVIGSAVTLVVGLLIIGAFVFAARGGAQPQVIIVPSQAPVVPSTTTTTTIPLPK